MVEDNLRGFEDEYGLKFRDKGVLQTALDHTDPESKKRYALAGDALLDFILFDRLIGMRYSKGKMDCIRQKLNTDDNLAWIGREMGLREFIMFPDSATPEDKESGKAYYNDTLEALVYAIMKDYGLGKATEFVNEYIVSMIPEDEYGCG